MRVRVRGAGQEAGSREVEEDRRRMRLSLQKGSDTVERYWIERWTGSWRGWVAKRERPYMTFTSDRAWSRGYSSY